MQTLGLKKQHEIEEYLLTSVQSSLRKYRGVNEGVWLCALMNTSTKFKVPLETLQAVFERPEAE